VGCNFPHLFWRQQNQAERAAEEKDSELEAVKAELAQLKQAATKTAIANIPRANQNLLYRRTIERLEKYQAAVEKYTDAKLSERDESGKSDAISQSQTGAVIETVTKAVNSHMNGRLNSVKANSIDPAVYQNAGIEEGLAVDSHRVPRRSRQDR